MPLIKWTPFFEEPFDDLDKMMKQIMPVSGQGFTPVIDMYQTKDAVVVETPLAGVEASDVEISIENDVLIIKGKSEKKSEVDEENYYRKEVRYGSFYRSIALPTHVIGDKAKASSKDGLLKIEIPKAPEVKAKTIKVKVENVKKASKK
jgi:HSP20 family protein